MGHEAVYMRRALELARFARHTSPNPRVGAVLVRDGSIVAEGRHEGAGSPHAETLALDGVDAREATLYVTLEPCMHVGRTPPCAPAVARAGVARVVVAGADPDERVAGRGLTHLRQQGIDVRLGLLEAEARLLNAPYIHHRTTGRPLVTLKLALTLDGRLAASDGTSQWITGPEARERVHLRRSEVDSILIGANTVLADDPLLTARDVGAARQPARVIVDATGRVPPAAKVFSGDSDVIVATTHATPHELQTAWKERGAEVIVLDGSDGRVSLPDLIAVLGQRDHLEIYCEGGGEVATSLLRADLVGRLELYYGGVVAGEGGPDIGDVGLTSLTEAPRWRLCEVERVGNDVRAEWHSQALYELMKPSATEDPG